MTASPSTEVATAVEARPAPGPESASPLCVCGHSAYWHSHGGAGDCEHDAVCACQKFAQPLPSGSLSALPGEPPPPSEPRE